MKSFIAPNQGGYKNAATATNYGTAPLLGIASSATSIQPTYIQFNLESVPSPYSANVAKAALELFVNKVTSGSPEACGVAIDGAQHHVALSAIGSAKKWCEDFGSAQLSASAAVITLEPGFAQTVTHRHGYTTRRSVIDPVRYARFQFR